MENIQHNETQASETLSADQIEQAMKAAQRARAFKKWGILVANIAGQIALGAIGCAVMLRAHERNNAKAEAANQNAL